MSKPINGGSFMPDTLEDLLMAIAVKDSAPEGVDVGIFLSSAVMKDIALRIRALEAHFVAGETVSGPSAKNL